MATKIKGCLLLFILLAESHLLFGQKTKTADTLQSWMSAFHMIGNLTVSKDSRFVAVNKSYKNNNDTVLVFDTQKYNLPATTLIKLNGQKTFFKDGHLLVSENGRGEFHDFKNNRKEVYHNVRRAEGLDEINLYVILDQNENLAIYNIKGIRLQFVSEVQNYITDKKSKLYLTKKTGSKYEILTWSNNQFTILYATNNEVTRMDLIPSGKHLVITEKEKTVIPQAEKSNTSSNIDSCRLKVTFINTATSVVLHPTDLSTVEADLITVTNIKNGEAYLIDFDKRIRPTENKMLDIWYGNDKSLRFKKTGTQKHQYYLWKTDANMTIKLPQDQFSSYAPINNDRYLLAFNVTEEFNYVSSTPLYNMYLFDTQSSSSKMIFSNTFHIIGSADGRYIMGYDERYKAWKMYDINASSITDIQKGLQTPAFSKDSRQVFFGNDNDLWRMDLNTKKPKPLAIAIGSETKIININTENTYRLLNSRFEINTVDLQKPLLIRVRDKKNNRSSYISWQKGNSKTLVPSTDNRIKEVKYDAEAKKIFSIEENFNKAPKLFMYDLISNTKKELFSSGITDKTVSLLKQDILSYTNSVGTPLKGILYYPVHFDPRKKYPMVVRIYQKQSESSGVYPIPDFDEDGFNLRILLERGYFVFLPDIIFDERGTGISALDCIHSGLDATSTNLGIDKNKIGLTGHSLGGYETNFIAAHSNRFAAYVSGSSVSDIVKFYFSYNNHFNIADYSRFEIGQFEMGTPFSESKEKYYRNNPINNVEKVSSPMLLWAGLKDENVPPDQTMEFYMGLLRNCKLVIVLLYNQKGHDLGKGTDESRDLNIKTLEWWDYYLKSKKKAPWIN
ncbi:prolyl oligopeptidase family serine peptidase [Chryseobacterium sp. ISL-6]|uniref:S9 family peptidase n=1 Tax=Chryseobacterium sp. ISL-6 TaxID=2819143 RepID=UPI001BEA4551|nr:prolyl oligopeptidase family serine peptidase [Chryseobacterium sp. ISL-6]MBT2621915.1 prolyl oligopeptidase family serine peptidase [Chryseobacterium sp. ISL-6]